jgi:hypothetical protein
MPRIARRNAGSTPAATTGRGPGRIAIPSASISAAIAAQTGRITTFNVVDASRSNAARSASLPADAGQGVCRWRREPW